MSCLKLRQSGIPVASKLLHWSLGSVKILEATAEFNSIFKCWTTYPILPSAPHMARDDDRAFLLGIDVGPTPPHSSLRGGIRALSQDTASPTKRAGQSPHRASLNPMEAFFRVPQGNKKTCRPILN